MAAIKERHYRMMVKITKVRDPSTGSHGGQETGVVGAHSTQFCRLRTLKRLLLSCMVIALVGSAVVLTGKIEPGVGFLLRKSWTLARVGPRLNTTRNYKRDILSGHMQLKRNWS